jgi:hypothetical protein
MDLFIILDFAPSFPYTTAFTGNNMKILRFVLVALLLSIFTRPLSAATQDLKMIFWYPGEAGTTQDAQGVLDSFFNYLNGRISPYKISGKYFNSVPDGISYLKKDRPGLAIVSFANFVINGQALGKYEQILKTLPLPGGKTTEQYVVVGLDARPSEWNVTLYSKQPLTSKFVNNYIIGKETNIQPIAVPGIIPTLKGVADGSKKGGVILQPVEYQALQAINQPWARQLSVWHTSVPVPSAPFLALGTLSEDARQKITSALIGMSNDPEGKKILETLRLKGFAN